MGTWTLDFTVGPYGVDEGGTMKVAQRFASDWEVPQFHEPGDPGYTTVTTTGDAKVSARYDPKGYIRPWMKCIVIDVYDGSLKEGDVVTITMGDRSGGSPGIRAQTFQESHHEFMVLVDPTNACLPRRVPSSPGFAIIPQDPVSLVVVVPMTTVTGRKNEISVRGEDLWGNPTPCPPDVEFIWDGTGAARVERNDSEGPSLTLEEPGHGRIVARWRSEEFVSNPTVAGVEAPEFSHYWGDLHAQSDATVGTGNEVEYFTYGRDSAFLDFTSHQGNDFQMTDEDWSRLNEVVAQFNDEGRFVVFPGYEWSANSPAGGDRNVFYLNEGRPIIRSSHWQIANTPADELTPAHPVPVLFERLRGNVPLDEVLLASHVGGRYADIRPEGYFDEALGPLVEVASCWGIFEWILWDAFDQGYTVGVMCNSDGHKGRPGAEGPGAGQFGIGGGLTCVLSEQLTRTSVFHALKERRCYGTSGPRIALWFEGNGLPMGSIIHADKSVLFRARSVGVGPLEALQLYKGKERVAQVRAPEFVGADGSCRVRLSWGGARIRGRGRRVNWDGSVRVSGNSIQRVALHAFDSPADGIQSWNESEVVFQSRTTGDIDGLDVWLADARLGMISLETPQGRLSVDLAKLTVAPFRADYGGLGIYAEIQRYPEEVLGRELTLEYDVSGDDEAPYYVKAIQEDGHAAWSSPIYVRSA